MASNRAWERIFDEYDIYSHDFDNNPFILTALQIKKACQNFTQTSEKEVRLLCKQDSREARPAVFQELGLFILPVKNGEYAIIRGEGYIDIPRIQSEVNDHESVLDLSLIHISEPTRPY